MLGPEEAHRFAAEWIAAWNSHDIDRVLAHWADECVFTSPVAAKLLGGSGTLRGKVELRAYWSRGLAASPGLRFVLERVLLGQDSVVISYGNDRGQSCAEWLRLDANFRAIAGAAHYSDER